MLAERPGGSGTWIKMGREGERAGHTEQGKGGLGDPSAPRQGGAGPGVPRACGLRKSSGSGVAQALSGESAGIPCAWPQEPSGQNEQAALVRRQIWFPRPDTRKGRLGERWERACVGAHGHHAAWAAGPRNAERTSAPHRSPSPRGGRGTHDGVVTKQTLSPEGPSPTPRQRGLPHPRPGQGRQGCPQALAAGTAEPHRGHSDPWPGLGQGSLPAGDRGAAPGPGVGMAALQLCERSAQRLSLRREPGMPQGCLGCGPVGGGLAISYKTQCRLIP